MNLIGIVFPSIGYRHFEPDTERITAVTAGGRNNYLFEDVVFEGWIYFDYYSFKGDVIFKSIEFHDFASFRNTRFEGNCTFENIEFIGKCKLESAVFNGKFLTFRHTHLPYMTGVSRRPIRISGLIAAKTDCSTRLIDCCVF